MSVTTVTSPTENGLRMLWKRRWLVTLVRGLKVLACGRDTETGRQLGYAGESDDEERLWCLGGHPARKGWSCGYTP